MAKAKSPPRWDGSSFSRDPLVLPRGAVWPQQEIRLAHASIRKCTQRLLPTILRTGRQMHWAHQHPPGHLVLRRRFDLVEGGAPALDLLDDVGGGRVPDEGLGILVPMLNPFLDGCDQLRNAGEDAAA